MPVLLQSNNLEEQSIEERYIGRHACHLVSCCFHFCLLFCSQLEWVLLDAHLLMLDQHKGDISAPEMAERCQRLSVLTRRLTIPAEKELLLVQRQVGCCAILNPT